MFILCGNDPLDNADAPYLEEFQSKPAPNFMPVEDLILCKSYTEVSEDLAVGTDQVVETFWGKIFETFICLSATEASNGTFYKGNVKSMRDCFVCTIQPAKNVFIKHFCSVKNRKISGVGVKKIFTTLHRRSMKRLKVSLFLFIVHKIPS